MRPSHLTQTAGRRDDEGARQCESREDCRAVGGDADRGKVRS